MPKRFSEAVGAFYDAAAEQIRDPGLLFLNYGFEDPDDPNPDWISPEDLPYRLHMNLIRRLVRGVDLNGKSVLEVSSGRGGNCRYLSSYSAAERIVGLDRCLGNVRLSRDAVGSESVSFLTGDAQAMGFPDETFDVVVNLEAAHCYADLSLFLSEVYRLLVPGGMFCLTDLWDLDLQGVDWARREAELAESGFEVLLEEDISGGVLGALRQRDEGVYRFFSPTAGSPDGDLRGKVLDVADQLGMFLALGECSYRLWRFRKPANRMGR